MFYRQACRANQAVVPEIADAGPSRFDFAYKREVLLMFFLFSYSRDARYVVESTITDLETRNPGKGKSDSAFDGDGVESTSPA